MPQIIVAADRGAAFGDGAVTFRERVNVADFESQHFASQLVERLGWAVEDADRVERVPGAPEDREQLDTLPSMPAEEAEEPEAVGEERVTVQSPA
ncbi:MAG TPA: hypothetical protein VMA77_12980 [Solirubrobacteraceae bacterium]|nr:hypothetical protein [Solirubrobacteraceae bacterium]